MSVFVFRLKAPRPTFALDLTDEEREIMARHAEYWRPWVDSGQMVIFGPVLDASGSWGLGVVEADDEEELRAFAADDPVVTTGTGTIEVGKIADLTITRGALFDPGVKVAQLFVDGQQVQVQPVSAAAACCLPRCVRPPPAPQSPADRAEPRRDRAAGPLPAA